MMKKILVIIIPALILAGCSSKDSFTVSGHISDPQKNSVVLKKLEVDRLIFVDSARLSSSGSFKIRVKTGATDFYQLGYSDTDFITLIAGPGEKIRLTFNGKNTSGDYEVSGSKGSEDVRILDLRLAAGKRKLDSLSTIYDNLPANADSDAERSRLEEEYTAVLKDLRKKNIEYIVTWPSSMASLKAVYQRIDENTYVLYDPRDLQYLKIVSDSLGRHYPESKNVKALAEDLKKELNQLAARQIQSIASTSPEIKLDPNLLDVNGKRIALSSLRGKVVLLTFWSVNSRESLAENIQLKEFYKTYKGKGFEIYQINIDEDEEKWKQAVRFDELPWISTREDDPNVLENVRLFNVQTVPANYLFDRDGTIIGTNLHGRSLQIKLNQLFNNPAGN
jgi:peroxiredoxin